MPKSKQECEVIRAEAREKIISKAIELFAKKGYSATSINDIADSASISVGLMYRYFSSKQELFENIAEIAISGIKEIIQFLNKEGSPKLILEELCGILLGEMDNDVYINLNLMIIQGLFVENYPLSQEILSNDKKMFDGTTALIRKGQKEGIFGKGSAESKSILLFSSIQGLTLMKFFFKETFKSPDLNEFMAFLYAGEEK